MFLIITMLVLSEYKLRNLAYRSDNILVNLCFLRYVSSELATDVIVIIGDVKFYLHKVHIFI